jgi:hypothetical protein
MFQTLRSMIVVAGLALCAPAMAQNSQNEKPKNAPINPAVKQPAKNTETQPTNNDGNTITPEQREMAKNMVGDWDTESSFWFEPGAPATSVKGHAKFEPIMGARFVTQEYAGKIAMPDQNGKTVEKEFKGRGLYGYNTVTKEYETTWIDSFATGISLSTGKKNAQGDIVFTGTVDDPGTGQKTTSKSVLHHESKDKMVFTMFEKGSDGSEHKSIEVVYTRTTPMGRTDTKKDETTNPGATKPTTDKHDNKKNGGG